ncbi:MAG TPA: hypothetical protein VJB05_02855 [archaeon]|nr:hypothetical protein [archaeon]
MRYAIIMITILSVLVISGCTSMTTSDGLTVSLQADPPIVFSNSALDLHIDVDNRNVKTLRNVVVELFDTGMLKSDGCMRVFPSLLPNEFQSLSCRLTTPPINESSVKTEVNSKASFETDLAANQVFEIMNEDEYQRRTATGDYQQKPSNYFYKDSNAMIEIDFSEAPPLVIRPDKKYFVYFTIKNIGNGFISDITKDDFFARTNEKNVNIIYCPPMTTLPPNGKAFPRIACEIKATPDYIGLGGFRNSEIMVKLTYKYEVRNALGINILR